MRERQVHVLLSPVTLNGHGGWFAEELCVCGRDLALPRRSIGGTASKIAKSDASGFTSGPKVNPGVSLTAILSRVGGVATARLATSPMIVSATPRGGKSDPLLDPDLALGRMAMRWWGWSARRRVVGLVGPVSRVKIAESDTEPCNVGSKPHDCVSLLTIMGKGWDRPGPEPPDQRRPGNQVRGVDPWPLLSDRRTARLAASR
jgi:hypothetical protein